MGARRIPANFDFTTDLWCVNQGMGVLSVGCWHSKLLNTGS